MYVYICDGQVFPAHEDEHTAKEVMAKHVLECPNGAMPWAQPIRWHPRDETFDGGYLLPRGWVASAQGEYVDRHSLRVGPPVSWREHVKTMGDLRAWLAEHPDVPDDTPIILARDEEGNGHSPLAEADIGWYLPEGMDYGKVLFDEDAVTAAQVAEDKSVRDAVEDGDLHQLADGDTRCVVLSPLN